MSNILDKIKAKKLASTNLMPHQAAVEKQAPEVEKLFVQMQDFSKAQSSILERIKAMKMAKTPVAESIAPSSAPAKKPETFSLDIVLNEKQLFAKQMAMSGKSFVLTGPAGTGKTTAQREIAKGLLQDDRLRECSFKVYDPETGEASREYGPSIAICAFTRRATGNIRKAIHKDPILAEKLAFNIMTIHALLEYIPEYYYDPIEGKDKFRFVPTRTASNPLTITHLVIEEASMLGLDLWFKLFEALPRGVQIIFLGDINQLPPAFGASVFNYALVQLPVVELTQVYRNQGIVLENAHNILNGRPLKADKDFVIANGKSDTLIGQEKMAKQLGHMFKVLSNTIGDDGLPEYDPTDCIVLTPYNVQPCGSINLNKWIAQFEGDKREAVVWEVIAGFSKHYLAVGDRVMVNRMDGIITDIKVNPGYFGKAAQAPGKDLLRFDGARRAGADSGIDLDATGDEFGNAYADFSLEALENEKAERKNQASHIVTVKLDSGEELNMKQAGEFGDQVFSLGYVLTVHKAQGSEWRKVFIVLHKEQSNGLYRELFYTAVTRARTKVTIIAKQFVIDKAIAVQRIKGKSLADKIEYFNSGALTAEDVYCTKD